MLGTAGASIILIVNLAIAGMLGVAAGSLLSGILGQHWTLRAVGIDAVLAIVTAIAAAFILTYLVLPRDVWVSIVMPVWSIAVLSVVFRHLLLLIRR